MPSTKERIIQIVKKLPDDCTMDYVIDQLDLAAEIQKGEDDLKAGKTLTQEQVEKKFKRWKSKSRGHTRHPKTS
jgi:hypothetical protein